MHRLARTGGTAGLLRWLAGRAEGWAGLVGPDGTVLHAAARTAGAMVPDVAGLVAEGASALAERGVQAYAVDTGAYTALIFPLSVFPPGVGDDTGPVLAVVTPRPVATGLATLLADVVLPLSLCLQAETLERKRRRVDLAESRGREAVLHLLMTGQLSIAQQVAGALRPRLPDPVRVCVVECSGGGRDEVARVCVDADGGRSWIVRCPVYARHLILVMPAEAKGPEPGAVPTDETVAARVGDCVVGVSEPVPLADTATGYRQAFHALAVARELPARHARFGVSPDPALVVGPAGRRWADEVLNPLLTHVPRRPQDPGSQELLATAASWLAFSSHATGHLKVHRNTLAARLRLIGELLGLDLHRLADQAALDLALRVRSTPAPACTPEPAQSGSPASGTSKAAGGLDAILVRPAVRDWADRQLAPVLGAEETLRTWVRCEGRLGPAAAELGISVPGVRKRLTRLETVLQRSLLRPPSARYDLWLALRSRDLTAAA
ncbi:helix-turn-helix domain-containing protein [Streptomyces sp. MBT67]|uniref:PucR family transcriptional regulator n=1 Tax=unclassified Streptomyces TaxID=2593676 RepID=UPI0019096198|nr:MULTISPECIES: helix-turn-helix domain-containing protein [unclassified Streptomyces]MBK3530530.1 helix-turn-helix domain-containing protein [Streptomyces sp. MBT72]MBK3537048.1 helix-turn-helix domain-containing protein [Streptomyces sp. MBT67]MBK3551714.1 helix-turn-helix domain-containing protein [Streptomyces sp. MBT61]MBK6027989.1 helix-turn-helix domain-containing protein [Streptomyces sp. MBT59]